MVADSLMLLAKVFVALILLVVFLLVELLLIVKKSKSKTGFHYRMVNKVYNAISYK